jgi:hypothetical protein
MAPADGVSWMVKHHAGHTYLAVVNALEAPTTAQFSFPTPPRHILLLDILNDATRPLEPVPARTLGLRLTPLEVRILRIAGE